MATFYQTLAPGHAVRTETIPLLTARIVAEPRVVVAPTTVAERKEFAAAVAWMGDANSPKDVGVLSMLSAGRRLTLCKMLGAAHSSDIATTAARILRKLVPPAVVPGQPMNWMDVMAPHNNPDTAIIAGSPVQECKRRLAASPFDRAAAALTTLAPIRNLATAALWAFHHAMVRTDITQLPQQLQDEMYGFFGCTACVAGRMEG